VNAECPPMFVDLIIISVFGVHLVPRRSPCYKLSTAKAASDQVAGPRASAPRPSLSGNHALDKDVIDHGSAG